MEDDWDLQALVRGCYTATSSSSSATTTTAATSCCSQDFYFPSSLQSQEEGQFMFSSDPFEPSGGERIEDLYDLFRPLFHKLEPLSPHRNTPISSPLSVLGGLQDLSPPPPPPPPQQREQVKQRQEKQLQNHNPSPRSKRRKSQMKTVCQVPAEGLSSDTWSWRKYGQKPIKGSPHPRGYYKCSTSKGCLARKQVERSRSDPGMFIVTYTAVHNHPMPTHRSSLAGVTRQKSVTAQTVTASDPIVHSCSPPVSPASLSPATEKTEESREDLMDDEDEYEFGVSNTVISDDFFEGLEEFSGSVTGDHHCFSDQFSTNLPFPWVPQSATATAAGDGRVCPKSGSLTWGLK